MCIHHWQIDTANGPTSPARCKLCGTEREFSNIHPLDDDTTWQAAAVAGVKARNKAMAALRHTQKMTDAIRPGTI